ncbi:hypothetical protein UA75_07405 [Actinoalloteichus sp. GBA129-24]|uniref:Uncharacterized protein n=1 Tax=Actinoalloteichus fjordicus TaxID=1612552 RepID=A0AAC9PR81_9PSEU|nr:hypothetical protein UA74_07410 [Actinoalloteichus fjordicus]APU19500.1 hypothetical protein UA75_07405 [Actinoalloteichus sp. GBA129-24]
MIALLVLGSVLVAAGAALTWFGHRPARTSPRPAHSAERTRTGGVSAASILARCAAEAASAQLASGFRPGWASPALGVGR